MDMTVIKTNGKWFVNGRSYLQMTKEEKSFFDQFIIAMKWESQCEEFDKKQNQKAS